MAIAELRQELERRRNEKRELDEQQKTLEDEATRRLLIMEVLKQRDENRAIKKHLKDKYKFHWQQESSESGSDDEEEKRAPATKKTGSREEHRRHNGTDSRHQRDHASRKRTTGSISGNVQTNNGATAKSAGPVQQTAPDGTGNNGRTKEETTVEEEATDQDTTTEADIDTKTRATTAERIVVSATNNGRVDRSNENGNERPTVKRGGDKIIWKKTSTEKRSVQSIETTAKEGTTTTHQMVEDTVNTAEVATVERTERPGPAFTKRKQRKTIASPIETDEEEATPTI